LRYARQLAESVNRGRGNVFSFNSLLWRVSCTVTATSQMLRIHRKGNGEVVFTLSGRIGEEDIAELEALIGAEGRERRITLDLKDMTLTGQDGIAFLAQCEDGGIALANCDPYVREWIAIQRKGS
jgi:hypothetical protein